MVLILSVPMSRAPSVASSRRRATRCRRSQRTSARALAIQHNAYGNLARGCWLGGVSGAGAKRGGHSGLQSLWGMGGGLDSIISGLEPFSGLAYPTVIPSCVMKDHEYTELQHLTRGGPRGRRRSMSAKPPDPQLFPRAPSFALRAARSAKREQLRALVDEEEGEGE